MLTRKRQALIHRAIEFDLTEKVSERLTTGVKSTRADKHRNVVQALLACAFADTQTLNKAAIP